MVKFIIKFSLLLCFLFTLNCGFKIQDKSQQNNFTIKEIKSFGDKRINFKIKNNLLSNSLKKTEKNVQMSLTTVKIKNIKEKNIKNEISKYEIVLDTSIVFNVNQSDEIYTINVSATGDYTVENSYSTTLNKEKKLIEDLINDISEKILDNVQKELNDI